MTTETVELLPFFEREDGSLEGFPAESYAAGFRRPDGTGAVAITLPADTVERAVLTGARLSLWLEFDGRLVLDGDGLSDEMLEAARTLLHDPTLPIGQIAKTLGFTHSHFTAVFTRHMGMSPSKFRDVIECRDTREV